MEDHFLTGKDFLNRLCRAMNVEVGSVVRADISTSIDGMATVTFVHYISSEILENLFFEEENEK